MAFLEKIMIKGSDGEDFGMPVVKDSAAVEKPGF